MYTIISNNTTGDLTMDTRVIHIKMKMHEFERLRDLAERDKRSINNMALKILTDYADKFRREQG
jgi:hypothetical protein